MYAIPISLHSYTAPMYTFYYDSAIIYIGIVMLNLILSFAPFGQLRCRR
jgi:hypothetical protein